MCEQDTHGLQNREFFTEAGGETFSYIPALNDDDDHVEALSKIINQHLQGWDEDNDDLAKRKERAINIGAKQ